MPAPRMLALLGVAVVLAATAPPARSDPGFRIGLNFSTADRGEILSLFNGNFTRTPAPDVNGGVGPDHVVLFIKGTFRAFDKRTGAMVQDLDDVTFWNRSFTSNGLTYQTTQTRGPSDPRILFDSHSNRWYAVGIDQVNTSNGVLNIAVTDGPDPTAPNAWKGFTLRPAPNVGWVDFPTVGLNRRGLFISSPIFSAGGSYSGTRMSFVPAETLQSGNPGPQSAVVESVPAFIANPVVVLDAPGAAGTEPLPAVAPGLGALHAPAGPEAIPYVLRRHGVPFNTPGSGGVQPNGAPPVNLIDSRIGSSVVLRNGQVWAVGQDGAGVRWFRMDALSGSVLEQGTIESTDVMLYFPSIAVGPNGDVLIGMNGSSSETFISAYAVAGRTVNGVTTFGDIEQLVAGADTYAIFDPSGRNRWGDYSTTVADPTDANVFWTFQEFVAPDRVDPVLGFIDNNRAMQITQIIIPEPTAAFALVLTGLMLRRR